MTTTELTYPYPILNESIEQIENCFQTNTSNQSTSPQTPNQKQNMCQLFLNKLNEASTKIQSDLKTFVVQKRENKNGNQNGNQNGKKIADFYVIPEMMILNSQIVESYLKRQKYIFHYLHTFEDFYRMSDFYLSHENPNIRSMNKLLRENMEKKKTTQKNILFDNINDVFSTTKSIQPKIDVLFKNIDSYLTLLESEEEKKKEKDEQLLEKLEELNTEIEIFDESQTITNNKLKDTLLNELDKKIKKLKEKSNQTIKNNIRKLEVVSNTFSLIRTDLKKQDLLNITVGEAINQLKQRQKSTASISSMKDSFNKINQDFTNYTQNIDDIRRTFEKYIQLSKIEDEDKRKKEQQTLLSKLKKNESSSYLHLIHECQEGINKLMEETKNKLEYKFIHSYLSILKYTIQNEIKIIYEMLNKKDSINNKEKSLKELYQTLRKEQLKQLDDFQKNYERKVNEIKQKSKQSRNEKMIKTSELEDIKKEIENNLKRYSTRYSLFESKRSSLQRRPPQIPPGSSPGTQPPTINSILDTEFPDRAELEKYKEDETKLKKREIELEKEIRNVDKEIRDLSEIFENEKEQYKNKRERLKTMMESMNNTFIEIQRIESQTILFMKKNKKLKEQSSNNFVYESLKKDILYQSIMKVLQVEKIENSNNGNINKKAKYKLKIRKNVQSFQRILTSLYKYYTEKQKFYNNRGSILSAFTFNIENIVSNALTPMKEFEVNTIEWNKFLKKNENINKNKITINVNTNRKNMSSNTSSSQNKTSPYSTPQMYGQTQYGQPYTMSQSPLYQNQYSSQYQPQPQSQQPQGYYQQQQQPQGYYRGGANETPKKESVEFITVIDKVLEDCKNKISSNEVYNNRFQSFIEYIDQEDKRISTEILQRIQILLSSKDIEYKFILPEQIRFIVRRLYKIQQFKQKIEQMEIMKKKNNQNNENETKFIYTTDYILLYFSLQYILINFMQCVFSKKNKLNR
jgi:hypothetical protein